MLEARQKTVWSPTLSSSVKTPSMSLRRAPVGPVQEAAGKKRLGALSVA
jgi:hypothetical protein